MKRAAWAIVALLVPVWLLVPDRDASAPATADAPVRVTNSAAPVSSMSESSSANAETTASEGMPAGVDSEVTQKSVPTAQRSAAVGMNATRQQASGATDARQHSASSRERRKSPEQQTDDACTELLIAPDFDFANVEWIYDLTPTQAIAYRRLAESPRAAALPRHMFDLLHEWMRQQLCWLEAAPNPTDASYQLVLVDARSHVSVWVGPDWFSDGVGVVAVHPEQVAELVRVLESRRQGPGPNFSHEEFERWLAARDETPG